MTGDTRFTRLADLVLRARALPPDERDAFFRAECPDDPALYAAALRLAKVPTAAADRLENFNPFESLVVRPNLEPGTIFGKYRIARQLAHGGMSTVYLAEHTRDHHPVAIKFLEPEGLRFSRNEHELLGQLSDDNIARIFDSDVTDEGIPYLVLEYVDGPQLSEYCESRALSLADRLKLFLSVCKGVQHAHSALIAHRDLKPDNILVTREGVPKILDFGIARLLPVGFRDVTVTNAQHQPKTLLFASPEQILGHRTEVTSDIYSLGVILCVLTTGRLPYHVRTLGDLYTAIPTQEPTRLSELLEAPRREPPAGELHYPYVGPEPPPGDSRKLKRGLASDLDFIVLKALRKEPEKRYQAVIELASDVERFLADEPISARKGSTRYRAWKYWKRHTGQVIGYGTAALAILGLLVGLAVSLQETARQRDAARAAAVRSEQLSTFLTSMFDLGDPFRHLSTPPTLNELLAQAVRQLRSGRFKMAEDKARFSETLARIYSAQGDFKMSLSLYQDALGVTPSQALLPKDAARKARIITQIADTRIDLGQLPEARQDLGRARGLQKTASSIPPIDLARWLITSARERVVSGGFHEAIELYGNALDLTANLPDAQGTAASIYQERSLPLLFVGRTNDALDSSNKAIGIGQRLYHKEHPALASMVMTRATILGSLGRYQNAAQDLQQAEDALKSTFGADHPVLSDVLEDRGGLAIEQQHFDQATDFFRQSFDLRNRKLGPAHMETLRAYQKIGEAIQGKGDLPTAETMLRKALQDFERFGYDNVYSIGDLLNNLGLLLFQRGNLAESQPLLERALRVRQQMHGPKSAWVAVTKANLSSLYSHQDQRERARRELLESIDIMKATFGPQHYLVAIGLNNLGTMYKTSQDYGSAAKLYREALAILKKADLGDSLLSSYPMINLSEVLLETGQLQEAHELIQRAQDILRTRSDPALPLRDEADGIEGTYLLLRGQFPEAEVKMKSSYEGLRQKTGPRSKQTQAALARLIRLYDAWGKQDLAAKYRKLGS